MTVEPRKTLADVLREDLGLTGTHLGCEHGVCGACTVLVDGDAVRVVPDVRRPGRRRRRRHRRGPGAGGRRAQRRAAGDARRATGCSAGSARRASSCRSPRCSTRNPDPDDEAIRDGLSGNLCRCTGYQGIVEAVRLAAPGEEAVVTAVDDAPTARREPLRRPAGAAPRGRPPADRPRPLRRRHHRARHAARRVRAQRHRLRHDHGASTSRRRASCPASSPCSPAPTSTATSREAWVDFEGGRQRPAVPRAGRRATCASPASRSPSSSPSRATSPRTPATSIEVDIEPVDADRRPRRRAGRRGAPGAPGARPTTSPAPIPAADDPELDAIFAVAAHVVTETFRQHRYLCVPMECRGIVSIWDRFRNELLVAHLDAGRPRRPQLPVTGARAAGEPRPGRDAATSAAGSARRCSCCPTSWPSCSPASASAAR